MHVPYLCCRWDAVDLGWQWQWAVGRWKHSGQVLADADHSARLHCVCQHLIGELSFRSAMFRCVCAVRRSVGSVRALTCSLLVLGPLTRLPSFGGSVRVPVRCGVCIPEAKSIARPSVSVPSSVLIRSQPPPPLASASACVHRSVRLHCTHPLLHRESVGYCCVGVFCRCQTAATE